MSKRDEFTARLQAKLDEWNAEIDELEANARKKQAQAKGDYHAGLADLKEKRDAAAEKLKDVQNASKDTWESLKIGAERTWDEMKQTFDNTKKALSE